VERNNVSAPLFRGVGVALLTMFDDGGGVDVTATVGHAKRLVDLGVRAVLVAGTTGEAETLDDVERTELVAAVRADLAPDVAVIAGASGAWARAAAARAAAARTAGADAVLVHPARGGVDQREFFAAVADVVGDPGRVFGYHNPGPLGVPGIAVETLPDLPIRALKDSSADPNRLLHELTAWDGLTYVGSSAIVLMAGQLGAAGALLAMANVAPEACVQAFGGDAGAQRSLAELHLRVQRSGLRALKQAAAERFGLSPVLRLALR
jgi:4-hydroxy-tetrahydrodipicolinate synthase